MDHQETEFSSPSSSSNSPQNGDYVGPQSRPSSHGLLWLTGGYKYVKTDFGTWIGLMVISFLFLLVTTQLPFINIFVNAFWIAGFAVGCKAIFEGGKIDIPHLIVGFKLQPVKLLCLSVISAVVSGLIVTAFMDEQLLGIMQNPQPDAIAGIDLHKALMSVLIMMALYVPVAMAMWFAPLLVIFHDMKIQDAITDSFKGCVMNMMPFLFYGLVLLGLMMIGGMTLGLALLIVMPVYIASVYVSYRDIYLYREED